MLNLYNSIVSVYGSRAKVGAIRNKSVDWSDSDTLLLGKSIGKAIVSLQIPEVFSAKRYKYFYAKNFNRQSDCIVSDPGIFKGEAIQVLLRQEFWISKAILSFQTPDFFKVKRYKYF